MTMERRGFIGSLGAIIGTLCLAKTDLLADMTAGNISELTANLEEDSLWRVIREQFVFPRDYIYFNTGGIGTMPAGVLQKLKTNIDEGEIYPRPGHNQDDWNNVKKKCTALLGPGCTADELALVSTATEGINIILNGLHLQKGDEVITSTHEHPALYVPLINRAKRDGIVIRTFNPNLQKGMSNIEAIERLITKRTKMVFISHVTCTTGQVFPVKDIGQLCRSKGILFALDGAQAVGNVPLDVQDCAVDYYAFSGHKWILGPKRTGILYVRKERMELLLPVTVGAYSDAGYNVEKTELKFNPTAQRYEYGTQNESLFYGLEKAVDFIEAIGLERIYQHNTALSEALYSGLSSIPGVEVLSPIEEKYRSSIISFKVKSRDYLEISKYLTSKRIRVRTVHEAGLNGIRVSLHLYNNMDEVNLFLQELRNFIKS